MMLRSESFQRNVTTVKEDNDNGNNLGEPISARTDGEATSPHAGAGAGAASFDLSLMEDPPFDRSVLVEPEVLKPPQERVHSRPSSPMTLPSFSAPPTSRPASPGSQQQQQQSSQSTTSEESDGDIAKKNLILFQDMEIQLREQVRRICSGSRQEEHVDTLLHVLKLCFASLAVVFRETHIMTDEDDKVVEEYRRLGSIPSVAARMLWAELLGGVKTTQNNNTGSYIVLQQDHHTPIHETEQCEDYTQSHDMSLSDYDPSLSSDQIDVFLSFVNARHGNSKYNGAVGNAKLTSFLTNLKASPNPLPTSFSPAVRRTSLGASSTASQEGWLSNLTAPFKMSPSPTPPHQKYSVPSGDREGWLANLVPPLSPPPKRRDSLGSFGSMSMSDLEQQDQQFRLSGKQPLLYFVRDCLAEAGLVEIAGRRVDDDEDEEEEHEAFGDRNTTAEEEPADDFASDGEVESDQDGDAENGTAMDFSGWTKTRVRVKTRRIQYLQIYQDMQYLYGVHLASLPVDEGGFAIPASSADKQASSTTSTRRELVTMKRWDEFMARACLHQLQASSVLTETSATSSSEQQSLSEALQLVSLRQLSFKSLKDETLDDQQDALAEEEEPWIRLGRENPFSEGTSYALRTYPAHLLRSGRVVEAARVLMLPRFFLGRVCAFGPAAATQRHMDNVKELQRRCDLADKGEYDLGGDGDCIDSGDVTFAVIHVMLGTLNDRFSEAQTPECNGTTKRRIKGEHEEGDVGRAFHLIASLFPKEEESNLAMECFEQALLYKIIALGRNHTSVARTHRQMGLLHLNQHNYKKAIKCYSEATRIERHQAEVDHDKVVFSLNCVATVYCMTHQHEKAVDCYKESLEIQKEHLGEPGPQVAETLNRLGNSYAMMGLLDKAADCFEEALTIRANEGTNESSEEVADLQFQLGLIHHRRDDHDTAIVAYQEALRIRKTMLGEEHQDVAEILFHMGVAFSNAGQLLDSQRCYEESLKIRQRVPGTEHEDVLRTTFNLGLVCYECGEFEKSLQYLNEALRLGREQSKKNAEVADILHAIGLVHQSTQSFEKAIESYKESEKLRRETLENSGIELATTLHNLGDVYYAMGELNEALETYRKAYDIRLDVLGEDDVDVAATQNNLGVVHMKLEEHEKAMQCFKSALKTRQNKLGANHEACSDTLHNLGLTLKSTKDYKQATVNYESALLIRRTKFGDSDIRVADTLYNLAIVSSNMGNYESALEQFKEALVVYRARGTSDDHPSVVNTLDWIQWAEKKLSKQASRRQGQDGASSES